MRDILIVLIVLTLTSCSLPFSSKKTEKTDKATDKVQKGEQVDMGSEPKPGDIKLVEGIEYIYAKNRRYMTASGEPEYVWYRKDQYSPGLYDTIMGGRSGGGDKKEQQEMERRLAKLESDLSKKNSGQSGRQAVVYSTQGGLVSGGLYVGSALPPSFSYSSPKMRRRILVLPLSDQTNYNDEHLNELATKRIVDRLESTGTVVSFDPAAIAHKGDFVDPNTLKELSEVYGVQAVIKGALSDLYVTTSRPDSREEKEISMAVSKIVLDVYNAETGAILRQISARNPFSLTRERGEGAQEKAKVKAIDLAVELLADDLLKAILGLDWHARIASIENERVIINAGRLSGLNKGDVLEVYTPGEQITDKKTGLPLGKLKGSYKGEVEVQEIFGVDAAWGKAKGVISFSPTDLVYLKLAK